MYNGAGGNAIEVIRVHTNRHWLNRPVRERLNSYVERLDPEPARAESHHKSYWWTPPLHGFVPRIRTLAVRAQISHTVPVEELIAMAGSLSK